MKDHNEGAMTKEDWGLVFESLRFTEQRFRDYANYPSYEFKLERLADVCRARTRLRALHDSITKGRKIT